MPRYRKRPLEVEAMRWTPDDEDAVDRMVLWLAQHGAPFLCEGQGAPARLIVMTVQGDPAVVRPGDWAIREVERARLYPCQAATFAATYEPIEETRP